nr:immunoglobulin mu heavy chain [Bos taurus]NDP10278.1 immunoglobulin mu heavy chain [Bos taurus]
MNPLWTLLFVLSAPRGVLSQVQLRESGPSLVKPSQTLSLTCTISGFSLSSSAVAWVRQAPGKALECLGAVGLSTNTYYNPALKSRLSITKDNSKSQVSLSLSSVTTEDTATYTCAKFGYGGGGNGGGACWSDDYWYHDAWGQGLVVSVSSEGESHPRVF